MLPGWDKLQDLRGRQPAKPDPIPVATVPLPPQPTEAERIVDTQVLADTTDRITATRVARVVRRETKGMSKLAEAVAGIKERKAAHDAKGEEWMTRINNMKTREPEAFQIGDSVLDEREGDLREMEQTMRELSNLPNGLSGKS